MSFDFQGSRVEFRVSSFETLEEFFEDLQERFRENDLILKNKTIAMKKTIDTRLFSALLAQTRFYTCRYSNIFFVLCIFYKTHAVAFLH